MDSVNFFEDSGKAAFSLGWTSDYFLTIPPNLGVTSVPSGKIGVGTFGRFGLAISGKTKHQREAIALLKFLSHKEAELEASGTSAELPTGVALYRLPTFLKAYVRSIPAGQPRGDGIVNRPSMVAGRNYEDVSRAYSGAVHSVLTGRKSAFEAAAELEAELEHITGFVKGLLYQPKPGYPP